MKSVFHQSRLFPWVWSLIFTSLLVISSVRAQLTAFPGAEGYGSIATGGRGGDVYYVTNLNASGAGSFAEGVTSAPSAGRTILFKVSGHIRLPSGSGGGLTIAKNKITVAGQTAPGDGIAFWNNTMNLTGNDLVLRHVRWRYGKQAAGGDAVDINGSQRVIFDHCDLMFATDENISSFGTAPEHLTFQWSTNAWGLSGHSAGGLWKVKHATVHHSLWANNHTRNPKLIGCEVFDWVNNLTFGWNNGFNMAPEVAGGVAINHRINIRNSFFVHGGSTTSAIYGGDFNDDGSAKFLLHMVDSALDGNNNGSLDASRTNYQLVNSSGYAQSTTAWPQTLQGKTSNPVIGKVVSATSRLTGYKKIISQTGATRMEIGSRPLRDEITQLCVSRAANLQRGIIADPLELNLSTGTAFAELKSDVAPNDTDLDGMPDDWEDALGLNKMLDDHNTVLTASQTASSFFPAGTPAGYTRLEEYLHFKSIPHAIISKNTAASPSFIEIDLRKFTSGFTALPTFVVSNVSGGTIAQSGSGNAIVRFTPTVESVGRGGFLFTVTDAVGDSWTQQCALLISSRIQPRPVTWMGDGTNNNWDQSTPNFASRIGATAFVEGDAVTIDDSGSNAPSIKLASIVNVDSLIVQNNLKNFTIQGTGAIQASGALIKSGSGALTFSSTGSNRFASINIDDGTLSLTSTNALGSTPIQFYGGSWQFTADQSNPLVIDGSVAILPSGSRTLAGSWSGSGIIQLTNTGASMLTLGGSMSSFAGALNFGASTGSIRLNGNSGSSMTAFDLGLGNLTVFTRNGGTYQLGSLTGGSNTTLSGASSLAVLTNYVIGNLADSTTFYGRISNGGAAPTSITKVGSGEFTLTHANSTYTGVTAVNAGSLVLLGNLTASPVSIAALAELGGHGTIGSSLTTSAGAIIAPGVKSGNPVGTLTAATANLVSPTLRFDLSNNSFSGNDQIQITGSAVLSGTMNFEFRLINGQLGAGTYDLIVVPNGPFDANNLTLSSNLPLGSRQTLRLEKHATGIRLVVAGSNANLTWTGSNGGLWNRETSGPWTGVSPGIFYNDDIVAFTDTATNGNVVISQPVAPKSITVNNTSSRSYTWTGAPITGDTALIKLGAGSLTLNVSRVDRSDFAITAGSPVASVPSTTGLYPGMTAVSISNPPAIPYGTTIVSVDSSTRITLSQAAVVSAESIRLIFESRNTYSGGTILHEGSLVLSSTSTQTYSSAFPPPANAYGLGSGPITLNGGILTLYGHVLDTRLLGGPLPNDIIVPAGKTATLRCAMRGTYLNNLAGLTGSLTGSGNLNLVVNYSSSAITGNWSAFAGNLNVSRPTSGAIDPRFQLGNPLGLPMAKVKLDQVTMSYAGIPPVDGVIVPMGSLEGNASSIISGAETGTASVTWAIGGLATTSTYAGNFTPYGNAAIGLLKVGVGTLNLTGAGVVDAGITIEEGALSYGDDASDLISSSGNVVVEPHASLQINQGATMRAATCEIFSLATLRGAGTMQSPLTSDGTIIVENGTLRIIGDTMISGTLQLMSATDLLSISGNLDLSGILRLPASGLSSGRHVLVRHSGNLNLVDLSLDNVPTNYLARIDTATPGELAVRVIDVAAYQAWQIMNFGSLSNLSGVSTADPDGDGSINLDEYINSTNPNDNLPLILTTSSSDAASDYTTLYSTYVNGVLYWSNSGSLTNRSVNRLILDATRSGGEIDLGASSNILQLTSGELKYLGNYSMAMRGGQIGASGSAVKLITSGLNTLTLASPVSSGSGSLSINGTAQVILHAANTFTGGFTLIGGTCTQGVSSALGANQGNLTIQSGLLDLNGFDTNIGNLSGNGGTLTNLSSQLVFLNLGNNLATGGNFSGSIAGNIAVRKVISSYTSTATLSGANSYTGITALAATSGSLIVSHSQGLGSSPSVDIAGTGTALVLANGVTIAGKQITIRGSGANNGTNLGSFSGSLTTSANASSTWAGSVILGDSNGRLGAGNSGTLTIAGPILGSGSNQTLALSSGSGSNVGTILLSGESQFTGNVNLIRGTLKLGRSNALPPTAILDVGSATVAEATTFDLNGCSQILAGLRRSSTSTTQVSQVTNSSTARAQLTLKPSVSHTYSGTIAGNLTLAKTGTGTLTLTHANALSPSLFIVLDAGALSLSSNHTVSALRLNGIWQAPGTYDFRNTAGRISGAGTLTVTTAGPIGLVNWINLYQGLSSNDALADPDFDSIPNLMEYVLNGEPNRADFTTPIISSQSATHFLFSFMQRGEALTTTSQIFEYSSSMTQWIPIRVTAPTGPEVTFGPFVDGMRNVTISIPKTAAPQGRIFGRLKASEP